MRILKLNPKKIRQKIIEQAAKVIKTDGILIYPTDTCYGIAVNPRKSTNLEKLVRIKKRPKEKRFSWIFRDLVQIKKYCQIFKQDEKILKKYFPGPFTFILTAKNRKKTIGARIPNFSFTQLLAERLNFPYTATSANISSHNNCYSFGELKKQFGKFEGIDLVIDAGRLPRRKTSTVVDLTNKKPKILRQGSGKFRG